MPGNPMFVALIMIAGPRTGTDMPNAVGSNFPAVRRVVHLLNGITSAVSGSQSGRHEVE